MNLGPGQFLDQSTDIRGADLDVGVDVDAREDRRDVVTVAQGLALRRSLQLDDPNRPPELPCRGGVLMPAFAEMDQKSMELMIRQPLPNGARYVGTCPRTPEGPVWHLYEIAGEVTP